MIKHQVVAYTNEKIEVGGELRKLGYTFEKFTDKGKLSKSDDNYYLIETYPELKEAAEIEIAKYIELAEQTESDMKRALELKEIIDNADFDGELVTIKHKVSKSKWYEGNGVGNMRSRYDVKVPASVEKEARELQAIRKKHQGNDAFSFVRTAYKTITVRDADHDNY
ncbi:hypothetical protein [Enterococcus viikkiensis]|uniref:hypothetical protein n=1 Tax=Enterococcus viikkiensis TaxID=930854 RepID=UPI0010FA52AB|nr:hypothetical protein [Enterococcus viikkiensis]